MKNLTEYIREKYDEAYDYLLTLNEQAFGRKEIYNKADHVSDQILLHLGKIKLNFDENDRKKHISDVSSWIFEISELKPKQGKKPKLSKLLFRGYLPDKIETHNENTLSEVTKSKLTRQHRYPEEKLQELDIKFDRIIIKFLLDLDNLEQKTRKTISSLIEESF